MSILTDTLNAINQNGSFVAGGKGYEANTRCVKRFGGQSSPDYSAQKAENESIISINLKKLSNPDKEILVLQLTEQIDSLKEVQPPDPIPDQYVRPLVCLSKNRFGGCNEYLKNPEYPSETERFAICRQQVSYEAVQLQIKYLQGKLSQVQNSITEVAEEANIFDVPTVEPEPIPEPVQTSIPETETTEKEPETQRSDFGQPTKHSFSNEEKSGLMSAFIILTIASIAGAYYYHKKEKKK